MVKLKRSNFRASQQHSSPSYDPLWLIKCVSSHVFYGEANSVICIMSRFMTELYHCSPCRLIVLLFDEWKILAISHFTTFIWNFVGMKDGQDIRFMGEGDQEPGLEAGDIIIVLDEKSHQTFRRNGDDLIMETEIELVESLCGFHKTIKTLDNRTLVINTLPGKKEYV